MRGYFKGLGFILLAMFCWAGCRAAKPLPAVPASGQAGQVKSEGGSGMKLFSPDFSEGQTIPARFTCDGKNVSPALRWSGVPASAQSLAVVCEDPDAPGGLFVHWIVVNIPAGTTGIPQGGPLPAGAVGVANDFGTTAYGGPCPPGGTHRYFFRLVALDAASLPGLARGNYAQELKKHALGEAQCMGVYARKGR